VNVLVCIKRVPATGSRITLTDDQLEIDTRHLGFTVSPHEECAVEEAIRLTETHDGTSVVLTLGPAAAIEQLQDALAMGIARAVLLETDGSPWDPIATADAIVEAVRADDVVFDLYLLGNEAADTGDHQVGVRVATALGLPCVTGVKGLEVRGATAIARREASGGVEVFELPLPAVVTVKEGINLPRFASVPGRIKARKKEIARRSPTPRVTTIETIRLKLPLEQASEVRILGNGPEAASAVVDLLQQRGVVAR